MSVDKLYPGNITFIQQPCCWTGESEIDADASDFDLRSYGRRPVLFA